MKLALSIAFAVVAASVVAHPLTSSANSVIVFPKRNHESNDGSPDDRGMIRDSQPPSPEGNRQMDEQRSGPPPDHHWDHENGSESGPGPANRDTPENINEHRDSPNSDPRSGPNPQSRPNSDLRSGPNSQMASNPEHHPDSDSDQGHNGQEPFHRDGEQRLQEQHPPQEQHDHRPQSDIPRPEGQDHPLSDLRPENTPTVNSNNNKGNDNHSNTNNDSHNNNNNGNGGNDNHDGPIHEHTERVDHPNGNPNNIDRLTHDVVNDNRNGIHSNVVQHVSVSGNKVSGSVRGNVVEGAHGAVSNGKGNVISTNVNNARPMDKKAFDMFKNSLPGGQFIPLF